LEEHSHHVVVLRDVRLASMRVVAVEPLAETIQVIALVIALVVTAQIAAFSAVPQNGAPAAQAMLLLNSN
jgi:hypothetical protein